MAKTINIHLIKWLDETIQKLQCTNLSTADVIDTLERAINSVDNKFIVSRKEAFRMKIILEGARSQTDFIQRLYNMRLRADGLYNI